MAVIVTAMANIYTGLATVIAFGVVYNSARISLSERARELASLRVLGFGRGEVMRILFLELALLTLMAQPPGWAIGYGLAWMLKNNMAGELMRAPLIVNHATYAASTAIMVIAAALSAIVVRRRIDRLDLVAGLKTRD
jgi:putative ABC transport system permease protein